MPLIIEDAIFTLQEIGLFDVVLPFILFFTIVFAALQRSKALGRERSGAPRTRLNAMVAFVLGFFGITAIATLNIVNYLVAYLAVLIVASIMFVLILGLAGAQEPGRIPGIRIILVIAFGLTVLYAFGVAGVIDMTRLTNLITAPIIILFGLVWTVFLILRPGGRETVHAPPAQPARPQPQRPRPQTPPELLEEE